MVAIEQTLVLIKPDGVKRRLMSEVIGRFEKRGFHFLGLKMLHITDELSDQHYAEHVGKGFYPELKAFITSGPVVAFVLEGAAAIRVVRQMVGVTDSSEAEPGSIRGDFALLKSENIIHASDSLESAAREIALYFPDLNQ